MEDRRGCPRLLVLCVGLWSLAETTAASDKGRKAPQPQRSFASNVRLSDRHAASLLERQLGGAARRLADPRCQEILRDFSDASGRPLTLEGTGLTPEAYLRSLLFYDGSLQTRCGYAGVFAVTEPGSPVVFVCERELKRLQQAVGPAEVEALIIHEMLHSLGLGENPPTSREITLKVLKRCAR